jgi:hypothetical protein
VDLSPEQPLTGSEQRSTAKADLQPGGKLAITDLRP